MSEPVLPRYPIYVPSKGRADTPYTATFLIRDGTPFRFVIEPQEYDVYVERFGAARILTLPLNDQGLIYARNWIKDHAAAAGYERHWQLDDNMKIVYRWFRGKRIPTASGIAFRALEDFVDRYENVAIAGLNYSTFARQGAKPPVKALNVNCHVYSCSLVLNSIPHRWRSRYNDDTDICLQVLADGWCTVLFNAFCIDKIKTMVVKGGNTNALYQGDGRLKMARSLERMWPGVVRLGRRFEHPQHVVKNNWGRFDTPLRLKPGIDLAALPKVDEYGMKLTQVKPIKSERLRALLAEAQTPTEAP